MKSKNVNCSLKIDCYINIARAFAVNRLAGKKAKNGGLYMPE